MNDFIYMYDLFTMNVMGMGEKPRNIYKNKGKIHLLVCAGISSYCYIWQMD